MGYTYALLASVVWGIVYTLNQKLLIKFSAPSLMIINSLILTTLTCPLLLLFKRPIIEWQAANKNDVILLISLVVLGAIGTLLTFVSIGKIGAASAALFEIIYPLWVVLFSCFLFGLRVNLSWCLGACLMFLGALIIVKSNG